MTELRSDTFTRPGIGMMNAMMTAEVGDDVFGEDPTVNELESRLADIFKMEAGIFCPSGTMTNQIAIKCHTSAGDEVITDQSSHVYVYEAGGIATNSFCQVRTLQGERGRINADMVRDAINPDDIHRAPTRLVCLENTANRGGGSCYEFDEILAIKNICLENNLKLHLDGARIWNALIAKNETPAMYGEAFDSISVCLSKGLGAPVGSVLLGSKDTITKARRIRKRMGGGMRQAGYLAAAGLYALENNFSRLAEDHDHASMVAHALLKKDFVGRMLPVETNIVIFEVINDHTPASFIQFMKERDIFCVAISPTQVRMVFHLDVSLNQVNELVSLIDLMS